MCAGCGHGWKFCEMPLVNGCSFSPSDQVSGVIMCCSFQRYVIMKLDGCGWKGCSRPLLPSPILSSELNQPFSTCRWSSLLATHIGFHRPENNSAISSHFCPYPSQVEYICSHSGRRHSQMNYSLIRAGIEVLNDGMWSILSLGIVCAHEDVNAVTVFPHADLFLW